MRTDDTDFLRFIGICLILNSHLDLYYPIPHIGTGGGLGNAIFFMLSGFGLFLSEKNNPQTFSTYLTKRILRIYPPLWAVILTINIPLLLYNSTEFIYFYNLLPKFIFPPYWFLQAILIFYLFGFFLIKIRNTKILFLTISISLFIYAAVYYSQTFETNPNIIFRTLFYSSSFMTGILIADSNDKIEFSGGKDVLIWLGAMFLFYAHKFLLIKSDSHFYNLSFPQQVALVIFVLYTLRVSRSYIIRIMRLPILGSAINYVSQITLEIYMVHITISPFIIGMGLSFPMNVVFFLSATFILAVTTNWLAKKAKKLLFFSGTRRASEAQETH